MTYKLTIDRKPNYLHAVVTGRNTKQNVVRYMEELGSECISRNCFRVLVEERLDGPRLGMMDVFQVAESGASIASGTNAVLAYVDVNAEGDLMQFAKTVAVNRGLRLAVFSTVAEAEKWLMNEKRELNQPNADQSRSNSST